MKRYGRMATIGMCLLVACPAAVPAGQAAAQDGCFGTPWWEYRYDAGDRPRSIALGDVDGDGEVDLVVANEQSDDVSIFGNMGDGTFREQIRYEAGQVPDAVAVGDVNGDGALDLVVVHQFYDGVSVLLNATDGTFGAPVRHDAGAYPRDVAIGDVDGDGALDLVVANYGSDDVSVLLNAGDGSFAEPVHYAVGRSPLSIALGDVNGDGALDLAVGTGQPHGTVSVLLNSGDGTFTPEVRYRVHYGAAGPDIVALGDLNGDGAVDLAVTNEYENGFWVLVNSGDGFQPWPNHAYETVIESPSCLALGDVNGDGTLDAAIGGGEIAVLLNAGDATFGEEVRYAVGYGPESVALGDVNGDGALDLGVASEGEDSVRVGVNSGNGTFLFWLPPPVSYPTGDYPVCVAVGDVNDDGTPDLAVANRSSDDVSILLNAGNGVFSEHARYMGGIDPESVALGDVNGDGAMDLVVAASGQYWDPECGCSVESDISVSLNAGDGTFKAPTQYDSGAHPESVALGDVNGDGELDLVVANGGIFFGIGGVGDYIDDDVSVLLNEGNGSFGEAMHYAVGRHPSSVALGDLNGDGALDLVVTNLADECCSIDPFSGACVFTCYDSTVSVLLNAGNGTFDPQVQYPVIDAPRSIDVGDVNGDGAHDLAVGSSSGISVLLGVGDGTFEEPVTVAGGVSVALGDVNRDGALDLVALAIGANVPWSTADVLVGLNAGDGTFDEQVRYAAGELPMSVALADVNGDGTLDVAVTNADSNDISILLNTCPPTCPADLDGSGDVGFADLTQLLSTWGMCASCPEDLDGDDDVGFADLTTLLSDWGACGA